MYVALLYGDAKSHVVILFFRATMISSMYIGAITVGIFPNMFAPPSSTNQQAAVKYSPSPPPPKKIYIHRLYIHTRKLDATAVGRANIIPDTRRTTLFPSTLRIRT